MLKKNHLIVSPMPSKEELLKIDNLFVSHEEKGADQASKVIVSASFLVESNSTVDRYLSPKLGKDIQLLNRCS